MDLRNFSETELDVIKRFTESLAEQNQQLDFEDIDLAGAERQAKDFVEAKRAGRTGKAEMEGDADARAGVREWLRRTGRLARYSG